MFVPEQAAYLLFGAGMGFKHFRGVKVGGLGYGA